MKKLALLTFLLVSGDCFAALDCDKVISTPEINECASLEFEKVDKELNAAYKEVMSSLSDDDPYLAQRYADTKESLVAAQRLWIKFREEDCNAVFNYFRDGTISTAMQLSCMTEHTKLRTQQLKSFIQ